MSNTPSISRLQELLPQLFQESEIKGDRNLRFSINDQLSALLPMETVKESLLVSAEKITPIPSMPSSLMGLISSRYAVFCVFDLAQLMGLNPLSSYLRQYHIVVANMGLDGQQSSKIPLGIAVHKIQGITRVISEEICRDKPNLPDSLKPYFLGTWKQKDEQVMILDIQSIFDGIKQLGFRSKRI